MTKYYDNNELVLTSKKDDYLYMVKNNLLNVGTHKSFHKDLKSAQTMLTKAQREIQSNIDYCKKYNYPQERIEYYQKLFFECKIVTLYKVNA